MQSFNNLTVSKDTETLVLDIYKTTKNFPSEELFGLISQMRRAAISIGANIAEGAAKKTDADFLRFLYNSMGSLKELEYLLGIANQLCYLRNAEYETLYEKVDIVGRKLNNLIKSIKLSSANSK